ncbi:MAG: diphosphomevalonate decarboxylase [Candidatus Diapherotrites archaeon]|nr:diphosphomevalonate decarboxylase [Candidatus Diapherotrites archaeon]
MKVTVKANANIALTKYWGKKDAALKTPWNSSTSVTLEGLETTTTVDFDKQYKKDIFILDGKECAEETDEYKEVKEQLDIIRKKAKMNLKAKVVSKNDFPTAAGFASSASGLAALTFGAAKAAGLNLSVEELSKISRMGSGSASRSLIDGFAIWHKGERADGEDSFAEQIAPKEFWPEFRILGCVISKKAKKIKSRAGMAQSVKTSPIFKQWYEHAEIDAQKMVELIKKKDFVALGELAQHNCILMHACAMTTLPPIIYWAPGSLEVMHRVLELQDEGVKCYFTLDGGPQVKIICLEKDVPKIKEEIKKLEGVHEIIECKPGLGPREVKGHLF